MNTRDLKNPGGRKSSAAFFLIAILAGFGYLLPCQAQQASSTDPLKQIVWFSGPQTQPLADCADIKIPQGYHLTGVQGARIALQSINTPVPDNLIGVLTVDSSAGKWWAILQYTPEGYLKNAQTERLDSAGLLKTLQAQIKSQYNASAASLSWESAPAYDSSTHSLSWSVDAQTGGAKVLNESVVLLGRHGYFEITAVRPYPLGSAPSLQQLESDITFKDGENYSDYQNGDKVAAIGLADLIVGDKDKSTASASHRNFGGAAAAWIYSGLGVCVVLGSLMLLRKRNRPHAVRVSANKAHETPVVPEASAAPAAPAMASAAIASQPSDAVSNGHQNGMATAKLPEQRKLSKQFHRSRKKKVFNYPKFYTNVMRELSLHSYGPTTTNGKFNSNGYANGHANGHANGSNGHSNGHANGNGSNGSSLLSDPVKAEIIELIATQKNLIQEQKCLLEQQTKLIEEKRWLIEEQTNFLKNQSGQQYPLKFE